MFLFHLCALCLVLVGTREVESFTTVSIHSSRRVTRSSTSKKGPLSLQNLPSIEQLSTDPFIDQVGHAAELIPLLDETDSGVAEDVTALLKAQLSHSDGIRGFFVSFLTSTNTEGDEREEESSCDDESSLPIPLIKAMDSIEDKSDLVQLSIMNVVMPTGVSTMHTDPILQRNSRTTARKGALVLESLALNGNGDEIRANCRAIHAVCAGHPATNHDKDADEDIVKYWRTFCDKYQYESRQRQDIALAMRRFL